ncbi:hypothetical protein [Paenibacillus glucanolyticus]|uniref:hypothetical protein n=1 Tax=Paenibacillus glucanolyticus TaxID=59843 RepID=UPI00096FE627|nr:hypothetical protein [Paenibacillus glucanolyticus]MPY17016.1 hypothetical protein [Paenibacillus glucanolyticus]OMF80836.1 hypothetical protein BK142_05335 [Paenibacillus glucanolyticus]
MLNRRNKIASVLSWIGVAIIITGIILGVVFGRVDIGTYGENYKRVWLLTIIYWATGLISGMGVIGLSEVIEQLHSINLKMGREPEQENDDLELING